MTRDYYEVLEVDKNATTDEIKAAFRKKARVLHPDVNKAPDAEEKFKAFANSIMPFEADSIEQLNIEEY